MITDEAFASVMAALGPFEPAPRIAVGVSGGADSMALALLARTWARQRGGSLLALVVDHRLRSESAQEAAETAARLAGQGVLARILTISGLVHGPALAERARTARYETLGAACAEAGILHLLLGHHAGDQAETLLIRTLGGSGRAGLAGMTPVLETKTLRVLRPLLALQPIHLRALLISSDVPWIEDPSNRDTTALRPRLRTLRRDQQGVGSATAALVAASIAAGQRRGLGENHVASRLAEHVILRPEGFAALSTQPLDAPVLAALLQTIAGAPFPPPSRSVAALAAAPRPATLAGVRLLPAGRLYPGLLAVREDAAMAPPVPAQPHVVWDGRFRLGAEAQAPAGSTLGPLGNDAARLRRLSRLPAAVLRTLPAVRLGSTLLAVPHLLYPDGEGCERFPVLFSPPRPAAAAPFWIGDA